MSTICGAFVGFIIAVLAFAATAGEPFADINDANAIPYINSKAKSAYSRDFLNGRPQRAFAIASDGSWGWSHGYRSRYRAAEQAVSYCQSGTTRKCRLYAVGSAVVWEAEVSPEPEVVARSTDEISLRSAGSIRDVYDAAKTHCESLGKTSYLMSNAVGDGVYTFRCD